MIIEIQSDLKNTGCIKSNDIIKSLMVITNNVVSRLYKDYPFVYRTHDKPKEESIEVLKNTCAFFGIDVKWFDWSSNEIASLLKKI